MERGQRQAGCLSMHSKNTKSMRPKQNTFQQNFNQTGTTKGRLTETLRKNTGQTHWGLIRGIRQGTGKTNQLDGGQKSSAKVKQTKDY